MSPLDREQTDPAAWRNEPAESSSSPLLPRPPKGISSPPPAASAQRGSLPLLPNTHAHRHQERPGKPPAAKSPHPTPPHPRRQPEPPPRDAGLGRKSPASPPLGVVPPLGGVRGTPCCARRRKGGKRRAGAKRRTGGAGTGSPRPPPRIRPQAEGAGRRRRGRPRLQGDSAPTPARARTALPCRRGVSGLSPRPAPAIEASAPWPPPPPLLSGGPWRLAPSPPRLRCAQLPSCTKPRAPPGALPAAPWPGQRSRRSLRGGGGGGGAGGTSPTSPTSRPGSRCPCRCCEGCSGAGGAPSRKALLLSRFWALLPWALLALVVLDGGGRRAPPPLARRPPAPPQQQQQQPPEGAARRPEPQLPLIYAITPTYSRPAQKAELTRLANTLRQVSRLHWVLVEDAAARSELVGRFVAGLARPGGGPPCTHLHVPTPPRYKRPGLPRATEQRNAGLAWVRQRHQRAPAPPPPGVLFFADDDNTYSLELFQEMRTTRKVSVWPVGLVGGRRYERPIVEKGKVVGWYTGWRADRPFAIDMAGFAVSLQIILSNPKAVFKRRGSQPGMQESDFLKLITTVEELEPKANNCTKVLVWHTRTEKVNLANEPKYHLDTVKIEV
uniref:galactosylgalactosylxylosylprotein 3-beta-glucuronosyltransferase 2 n=1 Tax=Euleptes europaea TaxID=460621 RepID=UPI002540330D|nr:galactosylgalactosylxylosylprotein 3-beta-glucuronosyltransferase 2 [Euleptes europaea]